MSKDLEQRLRTGVWQSLKLAHAEGRILWPPEVTEDGQVSRIEIRGTLTTDGD